MIKTLSELAPFLSLLVSAFTFIVSVGLWAARKTFANKTEFDAAAKAAEQAHHRLDLIDERLKQLPTSRDINVLGDKVSAMATDLRENSVRVETAVLGVKRIEDYMIQGDAKR